MALEQQIVSWAATRPAWQRHVLLRSARGEVLKASDYDRLVEAIVESQSLEGDALNVEDLPQTTQGDEPVRLASVANPDHVNALASDQPLTFALAGLTVVYGDNGTGKSGYARLFKRIARSRHHEEVLSDVFRDTSLTRPTAQVAVHVGDREESLSWPESSLPELQRMLFYDSACGGAYISTESDFPYRPSALFVMERLIEACTEIRDRIDVKLRENAEAAVELPVVEEVLSDTNAGQFLERLPGASTTEQLDALIGGLDATTDSIEGLKEEERQLRSADTSKERQRLTRNAAKLDSVAEHLEKLQSVLSAGSLSGLQNLRNHVQSLQRAATVLAESFRSEPFAGVGTSPWMELWGSARRYSEAHAYPDASFPAVGAGCRCVLCQQPLEDEGRDRLRRFDEFVRNDTQTRLAEATRSLRESISQISNLMTASEVVVSNLVDLEPTHAGLVAEVRLALTAAEAARATLVEALRGSDDAPNTNVPFSALLTQCREAATAARCDADALADPAAIRDRLAATSKRWRELELLQSLKEQREQILGEIARRNTRARLEDAKNAAATGAITKKISDLSAEEITEVIRDRFTRETDRLGLERVTITKTRAERTALLHQPKLVGARQEITLPRVLSEGERTALGLAAFFTEALLDASKSALILDDPVSSLDHIRRSLVATRLVELARDRQVIVFTHDVAFVADLKREANGKDVLVAERSVVRSRAGDRKPGTCTTKHPWKAKDVAERLGDLRGELDRIKKECESWEQDGYETEIADWAGRLSEVWERIFSQEIVGPILAEGGLEVRPTMVRILPRFSDDDNNEFQASYSRVSQWARRHDKSDKVNYVAPEANALEQELELVDRWYKRVKGYKTP